MVSKPYKPWELSFIALDSYLLWPSLKSGLEVGGDESNFVFDDTKKEIVFIYVYMHYKPNVCIISVYFIRHLLFSV